MLPVLGKKTLRAWTDVRKAAKKRGDRKGRVSMTRGRTQLSRARITGKEHMTGETSGCSEETTGTSQLWGRRRSSPTTHGEYLRVIPLIEIWGPIRKGSSSEEGKRPAGIARGHLIKKGSERGNGMKMEGRKNN